MFLSQRFPERSNVPESNDGMEKWVGKQSERERRRKRKRKKEKMSVYLALTKKEKVPPPEQLSIQTTR